jgi:D-tyrosyl-tRNA(Tyr) deacylase
VLTVLQRVQRAAVRVDGEIVGEIGKGALLLACIEATDTPAEVEVSAAKVSGLRFFPGETPMDRSLLDVSGACLVVSQFTLAGSVRKGKRPSFTNSAEPEKARELYELFVESLRQQGLSVATGRFAAMMSIDMLADGPVTLLIEAREGRVL